MAMSEVMIDQRHYRPTTYVLIRPGPIITSFRSHAGVVLSAACMAAGRVMSSTSLIHAVLRVEQLMTAGDHRYCTPYQYSSVSQCMYNLK